MKTNLVLSGIAIVLSLLIGYLVYLVAEGNRYDIVVGIGGAICFAVSLMPAIGMKYESGRLSLNMRVLSLLAFGMFALSNFVFAMVDSKIAYYIIVNGILLCLYIGGLYSLLKADV